MAMMVTTRYMAEVAGDDARAVVMVMIVWMVVPVTMTYLVVLATIPISSVRDMAVDLISDTDATFIIWTDCFFKSGIATINCVWRRCRRATDKVAFILSNT